MNLELTHWKLVLLDIDGTLLLSRGSALHAMNMAGRKVFGSACEFDEVDRFGRLDPHILEAALAHHGIDATDAEREQFRQCYFQALREQIHVARALPGAGELVRRLAGVERLVLGLVTGNYREAAQIKLDAVDIGMEPFMANGFGEEAPDRPSLVRLAIERAERFSGAAIAGGQVLVVGDTPRDVACAEANGCRHLAVTTGQFDEATLRRLGAKTVIPDLRDPKPLWQFLENGDDRS